MLYVHVSVTAAQKNNQQVNLFSSFTQSILFRALINKLGKPAMKKNIKMSDIYQKGGVGSEKRVNKI